MATKKKSDATTANKAKSFWTFGNRVLTIFAVIGIICLFVLIFRAIKHSQREKETAFEVAVRQNTPKQPTPQSPPTPRNPPSVPAAKVALSKAEKDDSESDETVEADLPPKYPDDIANASERRAAIKRYMHDFSVFLIASKKVSVVYGYPSAQYYIQTCTSGSAYYAHCRRIREAIETYDWKASSIYTYCKGGGVPKKKPNFKRQTKIARKKRKLAKDLEGAGLPDPDTLR